MNLAALYVYWVIVGWIFVTGVGLIPLIPEELAVSGLGVWVHQNPDAFLLFSWLVCIGAVLGTDLFLYMIGRVSGPKLLQRKTVQRFLKPERVQTFSRKFQRKGIWFMLTARLIPGWRSAVFITAGVIHYPAGRFVLADAISSVPLVSFFFLGGYFAADWINGIIGQLHQAQNMILFVVFLAAIILGVILYMRWMRQREQEEAAEEAIAHEQMEKHVQAGEPVPLPNLSPSANGACHSGAESAVRSQSQ